MSDEPPEPLNLALIDAATETGWLWRPGDAERRGGCIRQWAWLAETGVRISLIAGYPLNLSERPFTAREALPLLSYAATRANPFDGTPQLGERALVAWREGQGDAYLVRDGCVRLGQLTVTDQAMAISAYRGRLALHERISGLAHGLEVILLAQARGERRRLPAIPVQRRQIA